MEPINLFDGKQYNIYQYTEEHNDETRYQYLLGTSPEDIRVPEPARATVFVENVTVHSLCDDTAECLVLREHTDNINENDWWQSDPFPDDFEIQSPLFDVCKNGIYTFAKKKYGKDWHVKYIVLVILRFYR